MYGVRVLAAGRDIRGRGRQRCRVSLQLHGSKGSTSSLAQTPTGSCVKCHQTQLNLVNCRCTTQAVITWPRDASSAVSVLHLSRFHRSLRYCQQHSWNMSIRRYEPLLSASVIKCRHLHNHKGLLKLRQSAILEAPGLPKLSPEDG